MSSREWREKRFVLDLRWTSVNLRETSYPSFFFVFVFFFKPQCQFFNWLTNTTEFSSSDATRAYHPTQLDVLFGFCFQGWNFHFWISEAFFASFFILHKPNRYLKTLHCRFVLFELITHYLPQMLLWHLHLSGSNLSN